MIPTATTTGSQRATGPGPRICLPDDVRETIRTFAEESARQHRALALALRDFMSEVPQGAKETVYELIAAEWYDVTGEPTSARTVRYWLQSVTTYTKEQIRRYEPLTDAQLVEAVKLASDCQNGATPQDICE